MPLPGPSPAIHAALCSSSSPTLSLSSEGSLPPLLWWQVPSEVFNHLSCKTPFNWNYLLADKLLESYQGGDTVVRVFHAGRFWWTLLPCSLYSSLFSSHLWSLSSLFCWIDVDVCFCLFPHVGHCVCWFLFQFHYFFPVWKLHSQAHCPVVQQVFFAFNWNAQTS